MFDKFLDDCKGAKAEVAKHLAAIESPAARVGIISAVGFVALLMFFTLMPWSLLALVGAILWITLRNKTAT